jgi:hypothetical protein
VRQGVQSLGFGKANQISLPTLVSSGFTTLSQDAIDRSFGAMLHMDHITMKQGSAAVLTAKLALTMTDEKTEFLGGGVTRTKTVESIVDSVHQFDGSGLNVRRW